MNLVIRVGNYPHLEKDWQWSHDRVQATWVHTGGFHDEKFGRDNGETWKHYAELWHHEWCFK